MSATPLPQGDEKTAQVRAMFDAIAPRYEMVNRVMTFGLDARWRRRAVQRPAPRAGERGLDVAAGTGDFARELRRQGQRAVATDLSLQHAARRARAWAARPSRRAHLPFRWGAFDGVTCGYALRNFTDLERTLSGDGARTTSRRATLAARSRGTAGRVCGERGFRLWFRRAVPFIGSLLSDRDAYHYLPASTAYLPRPRRDRSRCCIASALAP